MADLLLNKETIKPDLLIVYEQKTGCLHLEDMDGNIYRFPGGDNKQYYGGLSSANLMNIAKLLAACHGLEVEDVRSTRQDVEILRLIKP